MNVGRVVSCLVFLCERVGREGDGGTYTSICATSTDSGLNKKTVDDAVVAFCPKLVALSKMTVEAFCGTPESATIHSYACGREGEGAPYAQLQT